MGGRQWSLNSPDRGVAAVDERGLGGQRDTMRSNTRTGGGSEAGHVRKDKDHGN